MTIDLDEIERLAKAATPGEWNPIKGILETDEMRCGVTVARGGIDYLLATIENGAPGDICETEFATAAYIAAAAPVRIIALIARLRAAEARVKELEAQLPDGMKHCTIMYKQCGVGHGRLTATNWIDHGCDLCIVVSLETAEAEMRERAVGLARAVAIECRECHALALQKCLNTEADRQAEFTDIADEIADDIRALPLKGEGK